MPDDFQPRGLGAALMRHLAEIACDAGLEELVADVLAENAPMPELFSRSGLVMTASTEQAAVPVILRFPSTKVGGGVGQEIR